ncbi:MAG: hypothetical protein V3T09_05085 [bacterium]
MQIKKKQKKIEKIPAQELIGGNFNIQLAYLKEEQGRIVEVQ